MKNYQCILFDLDGTLIDSYAAIRSSVNYILNQDGFDSTSMETVRKSVGDGLAVLLERIYPKQIDDMNELKKRFILHHETVIGSETHVLPGVNKTLEWLKEKEFKVGICSNKPIHMTEIIVDQLSWSEYFGTLMGPESVPNQKPEPDMLLKAAGILQVDLSEILYIGDMTIDIEAARAANVDVFTVTSGSHSEQILKDANPDCILHNMSELIDLLQ